MKKKSNDKLEKLVEKGQKGRAFYLLTKNLI